MNLYLVVIIRTDVGWKMEPSERYNNINISYFYGIFPHMDYSFLD